MKKIICVIMILLCLLMVGCGDVGEEESNKSTSEAAISKGSGLKKQETLNSNKSAKEQELSPGQQALAELQSEISGTGNLCAVAYLGYLEGDDTDISAYLEANGFTEAFPFLLEVTQDRVLQAEGGELYAVVPTDNEVILTVQEFMMEEGDDMPRAGEELLQVSDGQPILLQGNISEIVPSFLVTARKGSVSVEYSPALSMEDGQLSLINGIYDFSPYDLVEAAWTGYDRVPDAVFCDTWYGRAEDGDGYEMALTLTLEPDGYAAYSYGLPYGDIFEKFEGRWNEEGNRLILDLYGGPVSTEGQGTAGESYAATCIVEWDLQGWALTLRRVEKDVLLYGTQNEWFTFLPFDSHTLAGLWVTNVEDNEHGGTWFYELQLYENAECTYSVSHSDGLGWAKYEGWWSIPTEGQLDLSMMAMDGDIFITPEGEPLMGSYNIEFAADNDIILTHVSGTNLTIFMGDIGWEEFWR